MSKYYIEKATGLFGGYNVLSCVFESWHLTLDGAKNKIKELKAADSWNKKYGRK